MKWIKEIIRWLLAIGLQVVLFNNLQMLGVCHPYPYIVVLLMFPIGQNAKWDMLLAAVTGLTIDIFCNSLGVHMAACILLAYLRRRAIPKLVFEPERIRGEVSMASIGEHPFMILLLYLTLIHHSVVFLLSAWTWRVIGWTIVEIVVSTAVTWLTIIIYNVLTMQKKR